MTGVIDLNARRERDAGGNGHVACRCGNVWWRTCVVIDETTGSVVARHAALTCIECGESS